jgi:hypothetical protein
MIVLAFLLGRCCSASWQDYEASNAAAKLLAAIGTSRVAYDVRRASMPGEPRLTELAGLPAVAPECTALEADDFVAPGATYCETSTRPAR